MENRIEQQVNRTFDCMNESFDIQVSPLFAENLRSRIANTKISRGIGYPGKAFYPAAIVLMMVLNLGAIFISLIGGRQVSTSQVDQSSVIASEYGIGQSGNITF